MQAVFWINQEGIYELNSNIPHRAELGVGSRVIVKVRRRRQTYRDSEKFYRGVIVGEGRAKTWWRVKRDGYSATMDYNKEFCEPEPLTST